MNKGKSKPEQPFRYRVTVPLQDADVINWMAEQSNPSFSVRLIIRAVIAKYGITDVTCLPVSTGLDLDIAHSEAPATGRGIRKTPKTSVSLTDIREGNVVLPQTRGQAVPATPAVPASSIPTPTAPAAPAVPVKPQAIPTPAATEYVPSEISDLM